MRFLEFVIKSKDVRLIDIIPLLQQIYVNAHVWNIDDTVPEVFESKRKYVIHNLLECNISNKAIKGKLVYDYGFDNRGDRIEDPVTGEYPTYVQLDRSVVNIKSLVKFLIADLKGLNLIPDELLAVAGIGHPNKPVTPAQGKSDPAFNKELGTLRNEKLKWDASIRAAAEIGLLFFDGQLLKPTTKDAFAKEFNSKVGGLPDTTVEMIYKALPSDYRHKGGKPKVAKTEAAAITGLGDLNTAIKAAVFAGTLYESRDAKDIVRLSEMLAENKYQVPPVAVLEKIVESIKDI